MSVFVDVHEVGKIAFLYVNSQPAQKKEELSFCFLFLSLSVLKLCVFGLAHHRYLPSIEAINGRTKHAPYLKGHRQLAHMHIKCHFKATGVICISPRSILFLTEYHKNNIIG